MDMNKKEMKMMQNKIIKLLNKNIKKIRTRVFRVRILYELRI